MKLQRILILMLLMHSAFLVHAQYQTIEQAPGYFTNPIFAGDYPDPSILVDGDDYYMVHSSFEYYPGLLIWHSKDLINWTPLNNALHHYVGSVWAPDLVKYNNQYFIYFPANNTNYVIWANNIEGPWSEPLELAVTMIDPGHVVDNDGNRYLYFSSGSYVPLSKDGLTIIGEAKHSYDGWKIPRDWTIECFCMEGPKLFKRGEYYYLTVAEGGTAGPATGHMVISARSKSPLGPWENSPNNPILRAQSPKEKWLSVGHGTVFEANDGKWWMIFHGYENDYYNKGRQTMLTPIEWTNDGWYKIPDNIKIDQPIAINTTTQTNSNSFLLSDEFNNTTLKPQWKFFYGFDEKRIKMDGEALLVSGKGTSVADCSPMLIVPADHSYVAEIELEIIGDAVGGLVLFYNDKGFSGILADNKNILTNLRGWQFPTEKEVIDRHVFLRLKNIENTVDMYYSIDGKEWIKTENSFEASAYHHNVLSGFLSLRIGLCAMGDGKVKFKSFNYKALK